MWERLVEAFDGAFDGLRDEVFPKKVFDFGWISINESVISGFIVVAAILLVALILRLTIIRKWKTTPTGGQMFLEWLVCFFDKSADEMTEKYSGLMGPYTFGAAAYICCGVLIELFGLRPAIADLGACLALALCTFLFIHVLGFMKNEPHQHHHRPRRPRIDDIPSLRQHLERHGHHGDGVYHGHRAL